MLRISDAFQCSGVRRAKNGGSCAHAARACHSDDAAGRAAGRRSDSGNRVVNVAGDHESNRNDYFLFTFGPRFSVGEPLGLGAVAGFVSCGGSPGGLCLGRNVRSMMLQLVLMMK